MSSNGSNGRQEGPGVTRQELLGGAAATGVGVMLAGPASAMASPKTRVGRSAPSGTLIVDLEVESRSFNPLDVNNQNTRWVTDQVHETLYLYDSLAIAPLLADGPPATPLETLRIDFFPVSIR